MSSKSEVGEATLTTKGQITIPRAVRDALHLEPGDKLRFVRARDGSLSIVARKRRSILDISRERPIEPAGAGRDLVAEIDKAITSAVVERERRSRRRQRP